MPLIVTTEAAMKNAETLIPVMLWRVNAGHQSENATIGSCNSAVNGVKMKPIAPTCGSTLRRLDNVNLAGSSTGSEGVVAGSFANGALYLASRSGSSLFWTGVLGDILICEPDLTEAQHGEVCDFLAARCGATVA